MRGFSNQRDIIFYLVTATGAIISVITFVMLIPVVEFCIHHPDFLLTLFL